MQTDIYMFIVLKYVCVQKHIAYNLKYTYTAVMAASDVGATIVKTMQ